MNQMINIAKKFSKYNNDEITNIIDEREKEDLTPWSGGEETTEYAIVAPLHSALSNIDSNNLEAARDNILDVLDIIKMKKVSRKFSRFLKIAQQPKTEVQVPHAVNKYIENKIKAEDFEKNDELDFALSALHSAVSDIDNNPMKAKRLVMLAIKSINDAIGTKTPEGAVTPAAIQSR
jgi:Tfp pilus assembly ATPase PilU